MHIAHIWARVIHFFEASSGRRQKWAIFSMCIIRCKRVLILKALCHCRHATRTTCSAQHNIREIWPTTILLSSSLAIWPQYKLKKLHALRLNGIAVNLMLYLAWLAALSMHSPQFVDPLVYCYALYCAVPLWACHTMRGFYYKICEYTVKCKM